LHSNLSQTAMLGFTPNVHETLLALTLHVQAYFWRFITVLCCALLSLPVICHLIEILLAIREWEREGMGITNGNENVIEVGTNRKPVCDFLLVINSNWHPISYRFWNIAAYRSKFGHCVFEPPLAGLGTTYDVHLGLIGKRTVDFLLVLIELFSIDVTAEALRAKIDRKSAISLQRGQFDPKFQVEGVTSHQSFLHG